VLVRLYFSYSELIFFILFLVRNWYHQAILALIAAYNEKDGAKDPGQTNKKVWDLVAAKLSEEGHPFTSAQCKWKFTYLKQLYMKEKKARGASNTGGTSTNFKYFEELDDFLRDSHKHGLPFAASSSRYQKISRPPKGPEIEFGNELNQQKIIETDENWSEAEILGDMSNLDSRPNKIRRKRRETAADTVKEAVEKISESSKKHHAEKMKMEERRFDLLEKRLEFEKKRHDENMAILDRLISVVESSNSSRVAAAATNKMILDEEFDSE
jgi:Myb/SANT-like DNA-binding domain